MTRPFVHIGLALAIVLAPTLCCCKAGWFPQPTQAAQVPAPTTSAPAPVEPCRLKTKPNCCHESTTDHTSKSSNTPAPAHAPECACCVERSDAALTESALTETAPRPTGELLALALAGLLAVPEHLGSARGLHPRGRPDGLRDARYVALFERHVLRC
ncbi:hypothetical protein J8F10_09535 [Gemmata sp. G18]|uniref:Uncharacterized protein n=1 Tax=Gemmata palustris TaxID=2822762 RepID=A0ABS5BP66_9BACT|nr:hypothetical protein [Gemmata palustris]MBP3955521.1 hypothetical protein [Gemmata palustris]